MKRYDVESYLTENGETPFLVWLRKLKDKTAQTKIYARLDRASYGNFGDWKGIKGTKGLFEMREHYGPGYRIFYTIADQKIILLLAGASKKDQKMAIAKAKARLGDFKRRTKS